MKTGKQTKRIERLKKIEEFTAEWLGKLFFGFCFILGCYAMAECALKLMTK